MADTIHGSNHSKSSKRSSPHAGSTPRRVGGSDISVPVVQIVQAVQDVLNGAASAAVERSEAVERFEPIRPSLASQSTAERG